MSHPQPDIDDEADHIPDDDSNAHHAIPESNIKLTSQLGIKTQPDEDPSTGKLLKEKSSNNYHNHQQF